MGPKPANSILIALGFLSAVGCGLGFEGRALGSLVWLPWSEQGGEVKYAQVHLRTLDDPRNISGPAAKVYWQAGAGARGFSGPVIKPRLARKGQVWLPLDIVSQQGLAVYGIFERLLDFDRSIGVEQRLRWPRPVGLQIRVRTPNGPKLNNALYDPDLDSTLIVPYRLNDMPPALNRGILAHEHFHAHFTSVLREVTGSRDLQSASLTAMINYLVIAGWNEGLADYYAYVFTGDPAFMNSSFSRFNSSRELKGKPLPLPSWYSLQNDLDCKESACKLGSLDKPVIYWIGTSVARSLFLWSQSLNQPDAQVIILKEVFFLLEKWTEKLKDEFHTGQIKPADFLEFLMRESNLPISNAVCEQVKEAVRESNPQFSARGCQL